MRNLTLYGFIALIIVIIGGINWLFVGLFSVDLVTAIFGLGLLSRLIFIIVGLAAIYLCYLIYLDKTKPVV